MTDESEIGQPIQQRRSDLRALPYQYQRFGFSKSIRKHIHILGMILPDLYLIAIQLLETWWRVKRTVVVVQDRNLHYLPQIGTTALQLDSGNTPDFDH